MAKQNSAKLKSVKVGLSVGLLFAAMHILFVLALVATKGACLKWMLNLHLVSVSYSYMLGALNATTIIVGLIHALIFGFVGGWLFAVIYNWVDRK
jgi:tetrahydromethanopterin S-methyltransferase subunit F